MIEIKISDGLFELIILCFWCQPKPYNRIRLHTESGREKRRVQLWCSTAGADSREEASGRFRRRRGHSEVGPENHIGAVSAVGCSLSISRGGLAAHRIPSPMRDPPLQNSDDVRGGRQLRKANHEGGRPHALQPPKVCPYPHRPLIKHTFFCQ